MTTENLTQSQKSLHYDLCRAVAEKGSKRDKKHGEYRTVNVFDGFTIEVDTYSYAISVYKNGRDYDYLGMNFGGFSSNPDMVKFWYGHKCLFTPLLSL